MINNQAYFNLTTADFLLKLLERYFIIKKAPPPPQPQAGQNQTRYLTLAGVNPSQTPQEARRAASQASSSAAISLHARKKALQISGAQVIKGADALLQKSKVDFHDELLLLRQHYRLRRSGDKILGDISFRTCGSMYNAPSQFEVIRDTENAEAPLRIRLPPELKSTTWMTIKVVECDAGSAMDSGKINSYTATQSFDIIFVNFYVCFRRSRDSTFDLSVCNPQQYKTCSSLFGRFETRSG